MKILLNQVLRSESFIEKSLVLVITLSLSGFLIPYIFNKINKSEQNYRAELTMRLELFNKTNEYLMEFAALSKDVSWFGTVASKDKELQDKAYFRYNEKVPYIFSKYRNEVIKSRALISENVARMLDQHMDTILIVQDASIIRNWKKCGQSCDWNEIHDKNDLALVCSADFLGRLAVELELSTQEPSSHSQCLTR